MEAIEIVMKTLGASPVPLKAGDIARIRPDYFIQ